MQSNQNNEALSNGPLLESLLPLRPFLQNKDYTDICIDRPGVVDTKDNYGWTRHKVEILDYSRCYNLAKLIAGYSKQKINEVKPILSATLPGGERVQVVIPPCRPKGKVSFAIRKYPALGMTLNDYEEQGAFNTTKIVSPSLFASEEDKRYESLLTENELALMKLGNDGKIREFLERAVVTKQNIIVSGSTGSGKTTLTKALVECVPPNERLLSVENVSELNLEETHDYVSDMFYSAGEQGAGTTSQKELMECALRQIPDRVFLAEIIRGDEAYYYLRNVGSGHPGSITTMHGNNARLAVEQLINIIKESKSGGGMDRADLKSLIYMNVDVIVQINKIGSERLVTEISYDPKHKWKQMG